MGLSGGEIAGIVIGVIGSILGLILIILILILIFRAWMQGPTKGSDNSKLLDGKVVVITGNR